MALHFPHERSDFRKIRTSLDYIKDFQALLLHAFMESDGEKQYQSSIRSGVFGVVDSQSSSKHHSLGGAAEKS
jgi:hypothetical protein